MADKSRNYPFINLQVAVDFAISAKKVGKEMKREVFAQVITKRKGDEEASVNSGAFIRKLSAFTQFKLVKTEKENVVLNEKLSTLAYPKNDDERLQIIREFFFNIPTFLELYEKVQKNEYIKFNYIKTIAIRDIGIGEQGVEKFMNNFIESGIYSELIRRNSENEILFTDLSSPTLVNESPQGAKLKEPELLGEFDDLNLEKVESQIGYQTARLELSNGRVAFLKVPSDLSEKEASRLINQIGVFKYVE